MTHSVVVFGSSSPRTPEKYLEAARTLGKALAAGNHLCINGSGKHGCMGALNDGVEEGSGRVRGVNHKLWACICLGHSYIQEQDALEVADGNDLRERKRALQEGAEAVIVLPGGPGTWDEMWEMVCEKGVGFRRTPIAVVNVDGFYEPFRLQLERAHEDGLLYQAPEEVVRFEECPLEALAWVCSELEKDAAAGVGGGAGGEPDLLQAEAVTQS